MPNNIPIDSFVLGNFTQDEIDGVSKMGKIAIDLVDYWLKEGMEKTQNKYNGKVI